MASPATADQPLTIRRNRPWQIVSYLGDAGLARPHIFAIDFEPAGTMWLATSAGLYRYDGFTWRRFGTAEGLPSEFVRSVFVAANGELWVGTAKGAGVFDGRWFDRRGSESGLAGPSVRRIVQDPDGTLWFCSDGWPDTSLTGGLSSLRHGSWRPYGKADGLPHDRVLNYFRDTRGRQFALTIHGLSERAGDRWGPPSDPGFPSDPQMTWQMIETPGGQLFAQQWDRLVLLDAGRWSVWPGGREPMTLTRQGDLVAVRADAFRRSLTFQTWAGDSFVDASAEATQIRDLPAEMIRQAPDGSVWAVGRGILLRWRYHDPEWTAFENLPPPQLVDAQGRVWFADDRSVVVGGGDRMVPVPDAREPLTLDSQGHVWARMGDGLARIDGADVQRHTARDIGLVSVSHRAVAPDGAVCVAGNRDALTIGLSCHDGTIWRQVPLDAFRGYEFINIEPDQQDGLWMSLRQLATGVYAIGRVDRRGVRPMRLVDSPSVERPRIAVRGERVWLYDYPGVFEGRRDGEDAVTGWRSTGGPYDGAVWHSTTPAITWFLFNGGPLGRAGISAFRDGTWRHAPVDWRGFVAPAPNQTLLLPGLGGFHVAAGEPGRDADFVSTPGPGLVSRVQQDHEGVFWLNADADVLRHIPSAVVPLPSAQAPSEVRVDRPVRIGFDARKRFGLASESVSVHYSWRLDDGAWSRYSASAVLDFVPGALSPGVHRLELRARDATGNTTAHPSTTAFTVLAVPLQERVWFWPALAVSGALLVYVTIVAWSAKTRLSRQAHELEVQVEKRTSELQRDIAERRRVEAALRESEQKFRGVFNSTFELIGVLAPDGTVLEANMTALDAIGATREEIVGRPFWETPWWSHSPALQTELRGAIERAAAGEIVRFEANHPTRDGGLLTVDFSLKPVRDETGAIFCLIPEGHDITGRLRAEDARRTLETQLREGQKLEAIGTLAGGVAHDFNNILTGIFGNVEIASLDLAPDHPAQERLAEVLLAAHRARDLVSQILIFSRRGEPKREILDSRPVIQEALKLVRSSLPSTIEIHSRLLDPVPLVMADASQIHQVLLNLATNAAQAMPDGGRLEIAQQVVDVDEELARQQLRLRPGRYLRLDVSDTGHGMEPAVLERIFEPFFTTKGPGEGTGLGLAVVHGIMENHDGAVTVQSDVGKGTCFHLYFPVVDTAASAEPHARTAPPRGHGELVLVVDDEPGVAQVATQMLRQAGYEVRTFTDPHRALEAFADDPAAFSLVLTDQTMPGMTGMELARELRACRPDIRIALVTGYAGRLDEAQARRNGIGWLVLKPYTGRDLAEVAHAALEQVEGV